MTAPTERRLGSTTAVSPTPSRATVARADVGVVAVAAVWGSSYAVMQIVTGHGVSVPSFLALRFATAAVPLLILGWRRLRGTTAAEVGYGVLYGTMLFAILAMETTGVKYTSAANAGFLITVSVVLVPVLDRLLGKRRQRGLTYVLTVTALIGCALLSLGGGSGGTALHVGDGIVLAAAAVRSLQIFLFGRGSSGKQMDTLRVTLIEVLLVAVVGVAASPFFGDPVWRQAVHLDTTSWLLIAYLGVLGTAYAFGVQLYAARVSSATRVAIIMATEPVFAAFFAVLLRGDDMGLMTVAGGALVVVSAGLGRIIENRSLSDDRPPRSSGG